MSSFKKSSEAHTGPGKNAPTHENSPQPAEPFTPPNKARAEEMARYGITRLPVDYYHFGVFRYTSLKDAIAQAKRASQR